MPTRRRRPEAPSLPDPPAARKSGRLGLYLPFAIALLVVIGWSAWWIYARGEVRARMDVAVEALRRAGYELTWQERGIGGYPLRMNINLTEMRLREPSGWTIEAPRLEAQTYMHALGQWVLAAPDGAAFTRPVGGQVRVEGKLIRASLNRMDQAPPRISFEGTGLTFYPAAGAAPFGLASADRVEFHLREGPDDQGGLFARVDGGRGRPGGLFDRLAGDKPVAMEFNATLSKMSAFAGADWAEAVRAWTGAGGRMSLRRAAINAGDASLASSSGSLGVGSDGRLLGTMDVSLRQGPKVFATLGDMGLITPQQAGVAALVVIARQGAGDTAQSTLHFQAGQTTLGPVAIGPAPRVY